MATEMSTAELEKKFKEEYEKSANQYRKRPNILVCGYTGSGKSSLIKAILGDVVPAAAIGDGKPKTMDLDHYAIRAMVEEPRDNCGRVHKVY